jgi:hypothetical protein
MPETGSNPIRENRFVDDHRSLNYKKIWIQSIHIVSYERFVQAPLVH